MKINTKVVFEWNDDTKQYEEIYCESYDYNGEVAYCLQEERRKRIAAQMEEYGIHDRDEFISYFHKKLWVDFGKNMQSAFWKKQNIDWEWRMYADSPQSFMQPFRFSEDQVTPADELLSRLNSAASTYIDERAAAWELAKKQEAEYDAKVAKEARIAARRERLQKIYENAIKVKNNAAAWLQQTAKDLKKAEKTAATAIATSLGHAEVIFLQETNEKAKQADEAAEVAVKTAEEDVKNNTTTFSEQQKQGFKDRVFGAHVNEMIIDKFNDLQGGSTRFGSDPNDQIKPNFQGYLGDRVPFVRMWSAVKAKKANPDGNRIFYNVVNENRNRSYEENELMGSKDLDPGFGLTDNPFLKPEAGITSVTSKTEGALGAVKRTTVNFVVHNKKDFENIFLPFFMKPGATVIVDFGWSDPNVDLYSIEEQIKNTPDDMSTFTEYIYGKQGQDGTPGYIKEDIRYGLIETIMGNVTSYSSTVTSVGSYECSIELVSQNAALLDRGISDDNSLKFMFDNKLEEMLIQLIDSSRYKDDTKAEKLFLVKNMMYNQYNEKARKDAKTEYWNALEISGKSIPAKALKQGIFFQKKLATSGIPNTLYITWGLFEDVFLNGLIANSLKSTKDQYIINYNTIDSYVRYEKNLVQKQKEVLNTNEPLPLYLFPPSPDLNMGSYNGVMLNHLDMTPKLPTEYGDINVILFRDVFVSMDLISSTFAAKHNVNEALESILDALSDDTGNIWKLKMSSLNDSFTSLSIQDVNLMQEFETEQKKLIFDVFTEKSIVTNLNYNFDMPKGGLGNAIAFGAVPGVSLGKSQEADNASFLKIVNDKIMPKGGDFTSVVSLPKQPDPEETNYTLQRNVNLSNLKKLRGDMPKEWALSLTKTEWMGSVKASSIKKLPTAQREFINTAAGSTPEPNIIYTDSLTELFNSQARRDTLLSNKSTSIAPILPFTVEPTVYGNTYLHVGDLFSINFLPEVVLGSVMFMVIGIEHKIEGGTWETTYSTVMRLNPTATGDSAAEVQFKFGESTPWKEPTWDHRSPAGTAVNITNAQLLIGAFECKITFDEEKMEITNNDNEAIPLKMSPADARLAITTFDNPKSREDAALAIAFQQTIMDYHKAKHMAKKNIKVYLISKPIGDSISEHVKKDTDDYDLVMVSLVESDKANSDIHSGSGPGNLAEYNTSVDGDGEKHPGHALYWYFKGFMELLEETRKNEIFQIHESQSDDSYDAGLLNDFSIKKEVYDSSRKLFNKVLLKGNNDSVKEFNDWIYKQIELDTGASEPSSTDIEGFATKLDVEVSPMQKLFKLDLGLMTMEYRFKCGEWQGNTKKSGVTNPVGTKYFITFTDSRLTGSPRVLQIPKWLIDKPEVPNAPTGAEYSVIVGNPELVEAEHNLKDDPIEKGDDVFYRRKSVNKDTAKIEYWEPKTQKWIPSTWFKKSDETAYHYPDEGFLYKTGEYTEGDGDAPIQGGLTASGQRDKYFHQYNPPFPVGLNEFVKKLQKHYIHTLSDLKLDAVDINTIKVANQKATRDAAGNVIHSEQYPEQWGIEFLTSNSFKPLNMGRVTPNYFTSGIYHYSPTWNTDTLFGRKGSSMTMQQSYMVDYVFMWRNDPSDEKDKWMWKYIYYVKAEDQPGSVAQFFGAGLNFVPEFYPSYEGTSHGGIWYTTEKYPISPNDKKLDDQHGWAVLPYDDYPSELERSKLHLDSMKLARTYIRILYDIMEGTPFKSPANLGDNGGAPENVRYPPWHEDDLPRR